MRTSSKKVIIALIFIICLITTIGFLIYNTFSKAAITNYVQNNNSELETYIRGFSAVSDKYTDNFHNWDVSYYPNSGMVEFLVSSSGLGSSCKYSGFYYSPQNIPLCYQEQNVKLQENESGWQWSELNGDNYYYTEKITDNWYWFEMSF